jgi:hypothetical protein
MNLNQEEIDIIEKHRYIWDNYMKGITTIPSHTSKKELEKVHISITGRTVKIGCTACVKEMLRTIYQTYKNPING